MIYPKLPAWFSMPVILSGLLVFPVLLFAQQVDLQRATAPTDGPITPYQQFVRQMHIVSSVPKTICYKTDRDAFTQIRPPAAFENAQRNPGARLAPTAQFVVNYTNFTPEAQKAFQYAVDIWSTLLVSPVPIRIQANWVSQDPGVLGSAGPASYLRGQMGRRKVMVFTPLP